MTPLSGVEVRYDDCGMFYLSAAMLEMCGCVKTYGITADLCKLDSRQICGVLRLSVDSLVINLCDLGFRRIDVIGLAEILKIGLDLYYVIETILVITGK